MRDYKARRPAKRRGSGKSRPGRLRSSRGSAPGLGLAAMPAPRFGGAARAMQGAWAAAAGWLRIRGWVHPRALFALGMAWLLVGTAWGLYGAWQTPLNRVEVSGNAALTRVQVAAAAGLAPGMPMAGLDPYATALRLMEHPRIAQAHVRRLWPGALAVTVQERQPAFLAVFAGGGSALIDPAGVVLMRNPPPDTPGLTDYPRIRSTTSAAAAGTVLADGGIRRGLEAAQAVRETLGVRDEPLWVDAADPFSVRVELPGRERRLLLPAEGLQTALSLWAGLRSRLNHAVPAKGEVDLRAAVRHGPGWIALRQRRTDPEAW